MAAVRDRRWLPGLQLAVVVAGLVGASAFASDALTYGKGEYQLDGRTLALWNARTDRRLLAPGAKVMFFGSAPGCPAGSHDGPVQVEHAPARGAPVRWRYQPEPLPTCQSRAATAARAAGGSMVEVRDGAPSVRLVTRTGGGAGGLLRAWGSDAPAAANRNIEGVFVSFRARLNGPAAVRPFADGTLNLTSRQHVEDLDIGGRASGGGVRQAKQQIIVALANTECLAQREMARAGANRCMLQYLFNVAIARSGVGDWSAQRWFTRADVLRDAAQGGMPVVNGPVPARGHAVVNARGQPMYRSRGDATAHGPGARRPLDIALEVTFDEFRSALAMIVASPPGHGKAAGAAAPDDLAPALRERFGPTWARPEAWALVAVTVAQEVHNPDDGDRARPVGISGGFDTLTLD